MKKPAYLIGALALIAIVITITIQNSKEVILNLLGWKIEASLILIIFISFLLGALTSLLFMLPSVLRKHRSKPKDDETEDDPEETQTSSRYNR
ncbi:MAG: LapA family protein [Bacteroidales bacterium]|nr:LapA family protein [Bacteroidales bacterium]